MHATSVAIEDNGVLIIGPSGSGKSDLALRLIDSGATLISDDLTFCKKKSGKIYLFSTKKIFGLIEIRGLGIITVPYVEDIELKIVVNLTEDKVERLPNQNVKVLMGSQIPLININPTEASASAKIKLKIYEEGQKRI